MQRTPRTVVTEKRVTRYFVLGKGYNSRLDAYTQLAKEHLESQCYKDNLYYLASEPWEVRRERVRLWWINRYPRQANCDCFGCLRARYTPLNFYGCTRSRLADLRRIARQMMVGLINPYDASPPALPIPSDYLDLLLEALRCSDEGECGPRNMAYAPWNDPRLNPMRDMRLIQNIGLGLHDDVIVQVSHQGIRYLRESGYRIHPDTVVRP
jgi:hypothetical protein